jgi:predicted house-cleaning noncanonical NTP pyrophosphatase (MazG superfamily)
MIKTYNKLVRDRIPEIIKNAGKTSNTRVLNKTEYVIELKKKLIEESKEVANATSRDELTNELADVKELYEAIVRAHDIDKKDIESRRIEKNEKNGAFDERIYLIDVTDILTV